MKFSLNSCDAWALSVHATESLEAQVTQWPLPNLQGKHGYSGNPHAWEDGIIQAIDTQRAPEPEA